MAEQRPTRRPPSAGAKRVPQNRVPLFPAGPLQSNGSGHRIPTTGFSSGEQVANMQATQASMPNPFETLPFQVQPCQAQPLQPEHPSGKPKQSYLSDRVQSAGVLSGGPFDTPTKVRHSHVDSLLRSPFRSPTGPRGRDQGIGTERRPSRSDARSKTSSIGNKVGRSSPRKRPGAPQAASTSRKTTSRVPSSGDQKRPQPRLPTIEEPTPRTLRTRRVEYRDNSPEDDRHSPGLELSTTADTEAQYFTRSATRRVTRSGITYADTDVNGGREPEQYLSEKLQALRTAVGADDFGQYLILIRAYLGEHIDEEDLEARTSRLFQVSDESAKKRISKWVLDWVREQMRAERGWSS